MGTRNILIVGRTGSGKSTLANVLSDTTEFEESYSSFGGIKGFRHKTFDHKGEKYRVVDTPGIGSVSIAKYKISEILREISKSMPEGISQVLFVVDERFTAEEVKVFELLKKDIFNSGITKFTTIVKTKFSNFKNNDENEIDKKKLSMENGIISEIVNSCNIIHVDNPPTNISAYDNDDQERIEINKNRREKSREILLNHLEKVCQKGIYKVPAERVISGKKDRNCDCLIL